MSLSNQDNPRFVNLEKQEQVLFNTIQSISAGLTTSLYDSLNEKNVLFSPASVACALALLVNGTSQEAESREEILDAFNLDFLGKDSTRCLDHVNSTIRDLLNTLMNRDGSIDIPEDRLAEFQAANSIWGSRLCESYIVKVKDLFDAEAFSPPETGEKVNLWIESKTDGHLKDLFPSGLTFPDTVIMLINSIYFHGQWLYPFEPKDTKVTPFYTPANKQMDCFMMTAGSRTWEYAEKGPYQVLNLPYKDYRFVATIVLPKEILDFQKATSLMTPEEWQSVFLERKLKSRGTVLIPRFDLEKQMELKEALGQMGIRKIFDVAQAKLHELSEEPLAISSILHKCRIEVDESGTKASAATSVIIGKSARNLDAPFRFECNRPFYFIIRTNRGIPLFISYIQNPT
ncbi:hypothetical protein K493DRAFT_333693 [Basidiobolus meristosporus CBS 931.73]|uniref:Serpin domain-containing protein n=1 Tax=Basidiobolus meristosporus CBS 931.73 TaxID=1314790 RepID=A0A1Y1Z408_9FUNG|nr:hypothetical protein K493DRAFT_333693 [Basidiobolus meristosporus CBS 931.73]|eukprot:ORY04990.1 hypothetical protein K493DRAFT_333693 [Basidiobolus meristosporus CBS 931.73]